MPRIHKAKLIVRNKAVNPVATWRDETAAEGISVMILQGGRPSGNDRTMPVPGLSGKRLYLAALRGPQR